MDISSSLSVVIPTFNRSHLLDICLQKNIPLARPHRIAIVIFDNASTDNTAEIVRKHKQDYPLIRYCPSTLHLDPDENFERALKNSDTEYVWLLGDTYQLPPNGIEYALDQVSSKRPDAIVFNLAARVPDVPAQQYADRNRLLSDLGWHMTCISCLVFSSRLILSANFERYRRSSFLQTGIIFEYLANKEFSVDWVPNQSVTGIPMTEGRSWQDRTIEVWVRHWTNFVLSLPPAYDLEVKLKCVKDHGRKTGLLSANHLKNLRRSGYFNYNMYRQHRDILPLAIACSRATCLAVSLLPRTFLKLIKSIKTGNKRP